MLKRNVETTGDFTLNPISKSILGIYPSMICSVNDELKVVYANTSFLTYFMHNPKSSVPKKHLCDIIRCANYTSRNPSNHCELSSTVLNFIKSHERAREQVIKISSSIHPDCELYFCVNMFRSKSEEEEEEEEVILVMEDLRIKENLFEQIINYERFELARSISHGIIHEFNRILAGLNIQVELLGQFYRIEPALKSSLDNIRHYVTLGRELIEGLNTFLKWTTPTIRKKPCNLKKIIDDILLHIQSVFCSGIRIEVKCSEHDLSISNDPERLRIAFSNIIWNAVEALENTSKREKKLSITIGKKLISGNGFPSREYAFVKIQDNGIGIEKERMGKIFDFCHTTKPKGLGIGLTLTKSIVEHSGGFLRVESEYNKGTLVEVWLPI